jgi:tetratricopeptide (TPR) repeat protein/O-antigen ligase
MENPHFRTGAFKQVLEITWLAVIFLIPLFFNPQSFNIFVLNKALLFQFMALTMAAFWVADWILNRGGHTNLKWRSLFKSPLHPAILIFGFIVALATALSLTPTISFWGSWYRKAGLLNIFCWILFFLILAQQMQNRRQLLRAVYTLLFSSGIVSIIGILQYFLPNVMSNIFPSQIQMGYRVTSTIGNPLFLSSFMAMVIPFNLALLAYSWSKRREGSHRKILIGLIILLALQFWCLWLAQYSITILLYLIAPVLFIIFVGIAKRKKILLGMGAISLIALGIIAGLLVIPLLFSTRSSETTVAQNVETAPLAEEVGLKTLDWRVQYWKGALDIIVKSPVVPFSNDKLHNWRKLVGYGPETFTYTFQLFYPDKLKSEDTNNLIFVDRPHNDYLYLATTVGLLGLVSFLSILAVFFYLCFNYFKKTASDIDKLLLIAMAAAVLQYMADIFFNLSTISPELVLWLILAMTYAIGRFVPTEKAAKLKSANETQVVGVSPPIYRSRVIVAFCCALILIIVGIGITIRPFLANIYINNWHKVLNRPDEQVVYALDNLDKATKIYPEDAVCWHSLGVYTFYLARHVVGEAPRTELLTVSTAADEKARQREPYFAPTYFFLADTYEYWAKISTPEKWDDAVSLYDEALQLFPRNAVIVDKWALALIIKGDLDQARVKLDNAASIDPKWAQTYFLSGLLQAIEGRNQEATTDLISPIQEDPINLNYYIDLNSTLKTYDLIKPLNNALDGYVQKEPDDWAARALLGITSLFGDDLDKGLREFDTAMQLAPDKDIGGLLQSILRLTSMSPEFKTALPKVALNWIDKLNHSPERATLLPIYEQLVGSSK